MKILLTSVKESIQQVTHQLQNYGSCIFQTKVRMTYGCCAKVLFWSLMQLAQTSTSRVVFSYSPTLEQLAAQNGVLETKTKFSENCSCNLSSPR